MKAVKEPVGIENDKYIIDLAKDAGIIVAAWGTHGSHLNRDRDVKLLLLKSGLAFHCLGRNADFSPKHPLYLRKDTKPERY